MQHIKEAKHSIFVVWDKDPGDNTEFRLKLNNLVKEMTERGGASVLLHKGLGAHLSTHSTGTKQELCLRAYSSLCLVLGFFLTFSDSQTRSVLSAPWEGPQEMTWELSTVHLPGTQPYAGWVSSHNCCYQIVLTGSSLLKILCASALEMEVALQGILPKKLYPNPYIYLSSVCLSTHWSVLSLICLCPTSSTSLLGPWLAYITNSGE